MEKKLSKDRHKHLNEFGWYTIQTVPGHEDKVRRYIEGILESEGMGEFIKEVLVPTETISEVKRGKKSTMVRKLYPGYIFVHMLLYDNSESILQEPWYFIRKIPGLLSIVGGDRPLPLSEEESKGIIKHVEASQGKEIPKVQYSEGDVVKIMDGPFFDTEGTIEKVDVERGKLKISVSMFGRSTLVECEYWQVQKSS
jgi:transcriptional antiterminator NusG